MEPNDFAAEFINELESIPELTTAPMRKLRRKYSKKLRDEDALYVFEVVHLILDTSKYRWIVYEFIKYHHDAFHSLDRKSLETLGYGMNSWSSVDCFSRTLSGPAWRDGLISEDTIRDWAQSPDRWWRRAALVSTVALNMRSYGGKGDACNTLAICGMLVTDYDDMVVKALSWALRELVVHDPAEVERFLYVHDDVLAARVKREVRNKLETGLKNP
ncbi:MAG: DNA alkylation repair protein [Candidatus Aegiribacteria sp.]|nr:DNA alkylation repair protein [Candidatus Aegiribacteria sp.]